MRETKEILLQILHLRVARADESSLQGFSPQQWADVYQLATLHRIDTLLVHQLRKQGLIKLVPPRQVKRWEKQLLQNSATNLGLYSELEKVTQILTGRGIKIIALKGLFLADKVYKNIGIRRMSDLDILIPDGRIEEAFHLLIDKLGYKMHGEKSLSLNKGGHIAPLVSPTGIIVELHWTIMLDGDTPQDVIQRAVPVRLLKANVLSLGAEDNLLYLCKHIAHTHRFGYGGLRAICDIAWTIEYYGSALSWDTVVARSKQWGWERIVYLALAVSHELIGAHLADGVLDSLCSQPDRQNMIETSIGQLFSADSTVADPVNDNISDFWEEKGFKNKLVKLFWAIFIPREKMLLINQLPPNSWRVYWLYVPRMINLIRSHTGTLLRLGAGNHELNEIATRRNALAKWLNGK